MRQRSGRAFRLDREIESERTLLYTVALLAVLVGVARSSLPQLLLGALAGVTAVSAYALARYVLSPPPLDRYQGSHLHEPFGYANALGIFLVLGVVLAVGLAAAVRSGRARLIVLSPLLVLLPTLYLTSSRGAWVALPVGVAVTLSIGGVVRSRAVVLALLVVGIAAAIAIGSEGGQPLTLFGENRPQYWHVAWQDFEANPVLGSGAGTFGAFWLEHRTVDEFVHDAHSLYIETLAELGPLGLALLVIGLAVPLVGLRGRQDRSSPRGRRLQRVSAARRGRLGLGVRRRRPPRAHLRRGGARGNAASRRSADLGRDTGIPVGRRARTRCSRGDQTRPGGLKSCRLQLRLDGLLMSSHAARTLRYRRLLGGLLVGLAFASLALLGFTSSGSLAANGCQGTGTAMATATGTGTARRRRSRRRWHSHRRRQSIRWTSNTA